MSFDTRNTRLAAALICLGCKASGSRIERLPSQTPDKPYDEVCFLLFDEGEAYDKAWRKMDEWSRLNPRHPFTYMHKVSAARDWILTRVVHGHHNEGIELGSDVVAVTTLSMACCFVAHGYYLLKLDKTQRLFYFPAETQAEIKEYESPRPDGSYEWMKFYLLEFDSLNRGIRDGNLTCQLKQQPVTCRNAEATVS